MLTAYFGNSYAHKVWDRSLPQSSERDPEVGGKFMEVTRLNIAIFAGFEHFTECIADFGLRSNFLAEAEPDLKLLFEMARAEEIEHKSVVYNVIWELDRGYLLRIVGVIVAYIYAIGLMVVGTWILLHDDVPIPVTAGKTLFLATSVVRSGKFFIYQDRFFYQASQNFVEYLQPHFHPSQTDNQALAKIITDRLL